MKKHALNGFAFCFFITTLLTGCNQSEKLTAITTIDSEFEESLDEWTPLLANYKTSSDTASIAWRTSSSYLPSPLDTTRYGFFLKSINLGDGMTMMIKKKIGGLTPERLYSMSLELDMATKFFDSGDSLTNSPASLVVLKAGTSTIEPDTATQSGFYRLNIPWGNADTGTANVQVFGDLNNKSSRLNYTLVKRQLSPRLEFTSNEAGEIWLILAVDSDYVGEASLYIDRLLIEIRSSID